MHVTLAGFVLFLHISVAIAAFMMAGVMHAALPAMARAGTVAEMRSWARVVHRLDPLFPLAALILLGLGSWLVHLEHDEGISWSSGWVITAVVALVVVEGMAGALLAPTAKSVVAAIESAGDGPVPDEIRRQTRSPKIWHIAHIATFSFLGVVFLMAAKPTGWVSVIVVVLAAAIGLAASTAQLRALQAPAAGAVPSQRAGADVAAAESV